MIFFLLNIFIHPLYNSRTFFISLHEMLLNVFNNLLQITRDTCERNKRENFLRDITDMFVPFNYNKVPLFFHKQPFVCLSTAKTLGVG